MDFLKMIAFVEGFVNGILKVMSGYTGGPPCQEFLERHHQRVAMKRTAIVNRD